MITGASAMTIILLEGEKGAAAAAALPDHPTAPEMQVGAQSETRK